jgi:hypothetical protein
MDANGQHKFRFVADYRKLNEKTTWNAYPLPDITEIFYLLGQGKLISLPIFSCRVTSNGHNAT